MRKQGARSYLEDDGMDNETNEAKDPFLKGKNELLGKELKILEIQVVDTPTRPFRIYAALVLEKSEEVHFYGSSVMDKAPVQKGDIVEIEKKVSESTGRRYYRFVKLEVASGKDA